MLIILHRYILKELIRLLLLSVVALSVTLTLGSIIRPIQRYGIGPQQVAALVAYLWPVTVTLVLPVGALFAATLTYGRLVTDNEYDACRASGVGPWTIVCPGVALATAVGICSLLMGLHVMPYFVQLADRSIHADLKPIVFRHLQQRGYYRLPGAGQDMIYADHADPPTGQIHGVVVVGGQREGLSQVMGADAAQVTFEQAQGSGRVHVLARNGFHLDLTGGTSVQAKGFSLALPVEPLLADKIKFKRIGQIRQIQSDPLLYRPVERQAIDLWSQALTEALAGRIQRRFRSGQDYELLGPDIVVRLKAAGITTGPGNIEIDGPVDVTLIEAANQRTWQARRATISVHTDRWSEYLTMDLSDARSSDGLGPLTRPAIPALPVPEDLRGLVGPRPRLQDLSVQSLSKVVASPSPYLLQAAARLGQAVQSLRAQIDAELHSRLAFGIGCVPMIVVGIGLGIVCRGGHPLTAFALSCLPAIILAVMILSGKEVIRGPGNWQGLGLGLIWSGVGMLTCLAGWVYTRLYR